MFWTKSLPFIFLRLLHNTTLVGTISELFVGRIDSPNTEQGSHNGNTGVQNFAPAVISTHKYHR